MRLDDLLSKNRKGKEEFAADAATLLPWQEMMASGAAVAPWVPLAGIGLAAAGLGAYATSQLLQYLSGRQQPSPVPLPVMPELGPQEIARSVQNAQPRDIAHGLQPIVEQLGWLNVMTRIAQLPVSRTWAEQVADTIHWALPNTRQEAEEELEYLENQRPGIPEGLQKRVERRIRELEEMVKELGGG